MAEPAGSFRLGFLYPGRGSSDDYAAFAARLSPHLEAHVGVTRAREDHTLTSARFTGGAGVLAEGAARLRPLRPRAAMFACTCASFVDGLAAAERQARAVADAVGAPAGSTSLAFLAAARALGLRRVAVAASYPANITDRFDSFLREGGLEPVGGAALGLMTARAVAALAADDLLAFAARADAPTAEALLIPDTAMRTGGRIAALESALGKPVLTANQVTIWHALALAGWDRPAAAADPELGMLFGMAAIPQHLAG